MTGTRFYLEHDDRKGRRAGKHNGNVFAAFVANGRNYMGGYDGMGAVHFHPNSPVAGTGCSLEYLRLCKRILERLAREIHPALFEALDREDK